MFLSDHDLQAIFFGICFYLCACCVGCFEPTAPNDSDQEKTIINKSDSLTPQVPSQYDLFIQAVDKLLDDAAIDGNKAYIFVSGSFYKEWHIYMSEGWLTKRANIRGWKKLEDNNGRIVYLIPPEYFKPLPQSISRSKSNNPLESELDTFIANKSAEIEKLHITQQETLKIMADKPELVQYASSVATQIDEKIKLLQSLKRKAEQFRDDVHVYEKVEEIRKWLNSN